MTSEGQPEGHEAEYWPSFATWRAAYDDGVFEHHETDLSRGRYVTLRVLAGVTGTPDVSWVHGRFAVGTPEERQLESLLGAVALEFLDGYEPRVPAGPGAAVLTLAPDRLVHKVLLGPMGAPASGLQPPTALIRAARRFLESSR